LQDERNILDYPSAEEKKEKGMEEEQQQQNVNSKSYVVGKESAPEILWSTHCLLSNAY
jgi:hypothetical protein